MPRMTPNLWFDTRSREAAEFCISLFPNSKINDITYYAEILAAAGGAPS